MDPRRTLAAAGLSGTAALLAAIGGASWYYASRLTDPPAAAWPPAPRPEDRVRVLAVRPGAILLGGPGADRPGTWGLAWSEGFGRIGEPREAKDDAVLRPFTGLEGRARPGTEAVLDPFVHRDPTSTGVPCREVHYPSPLGDIPAWHFPGAADTWVVFVHGRQARRHECLRLVPTVHALGLPSLAIAYRNDPDGPRSPDGRGHLGATEWEDLEAAVAYARSNGASDVIVIGFSMGGGCAVTFARVSPLARHLRALVLDAPVLDWRPVIRQAAIDRGLPAPVLPMLLPASMALAARRAGIDWRALDHLRDPAGLSRPTLLIHGTADPVVPVALADALAAAHPELTYLRVEGAGHVRSWNHEPERYDATLRDFLAAALARPEPPGVVGSLPR